MSKIPFILITGFLGSGKTSLLLDLVHKYSAELRFAIVQNEFAPGHVDGITLRHSGEGFDLLEINNGSVFCACLLSDFIDRLEPFIKKVNPDVILLEATGLADPVSLGQIIHSGKLTDRIYLAATWCIVDAANFHRIIDTVSRTRQQVRIADLIWINKTDLISDASEIRKKITDINPFAKIFETTFGSTQSFDFRLLLKPNARKPKPGMQLEVLHNTLSEPRPQVGSCVVRSNRFFHTTSIEHFVRDQAPRLYRMKGYIRINSDETLAVQCVFNEIKIDRISGYVGPTELIAMGPGLDNREFSKQFLALQTNR